MDKVASKCLKKFMTYFAMLAFMAGSHLLTASFQNFDLNVEYCGSLDDGKTTKVTKKTLKNRIHVC